MLIKRSVLLVAALGMSLARGCACRVTPTSGYPPLTAAAPSASIEVPPEASAPPATVDLAAFGPLLADRRLASVASRVDQNDPGAAAVELERLLVAAPPAEEDRIRWIYQAARLHAQARRPADALRLYGAAGEVPWPLAPYAALGAAQQAAALGQQDEALKWASRVADDSPAWAQARLVRAEALEARGDLAQAITLWKAHLDTPKAPRSAEISLRAARALIKLGGPGAAEQALTLARKVAVEQPTSPQAPKAQEVEREAAALLPPDHQWMAQRSPDDELTRLGALLEASKLEEVSRGVDAFEQAQGAAAKEGQVGCRLSLIEGKLLVRRKRQSEASDRYGDAIRLCEGEPKILALFGGGGASLAGGRPADALARFDQLETLAPTHRLADDARLKGALASLSLGDEARFSEKLERIDKIDPDGDMTTEGLFRLALLRMGKGDWAGAAAPLEASVRLRPREVDYRAAGRAGYFLGRALLATGDRARALDRFAAVIVDSPLSYYMSLAHARLAELDPRRAEEALKQATSRVDAPPTVPDHPSLHAAGFVRGLELLRQGDTEGARVEFTTAGMLGPGAPPGLQWAVASLYGQAGALVLAHTIPRGKLFDWLEHYPVGAWRGPWEIAYPRPYLATVTAEAKKSGIPAALAYAIMREESSFDPTAVSGAPAYGLMQFTLDTGKHIGKKLGLSINDAALKTPAVSIALGCRYLADLRERYPTCPALAIPSYNAGPGKIRRWVSQRPIEDLDLFVERIPYDETRDYTKRVLKSYAAYLFLYENDQLAEALRLPARTQGGVAAASPALPASPAEPEADPPADGAP
jgi:soluble lytic murein transglycosylase